MFRFATERVRKQVANMLMTERPQRDFPYPSTTAPDCFELAHQRVTAIDFSEGMLAEAQAKPGANQAQWICHDIHTPLPVVDGEFDLVVSGLVLEHLRDLDHFFGEIARVLK